MPFEISHDYGSQFATIHLRGEATLENFAHLIAHIHLDSKAKGYTRVLVNLQQTTGKPSFSGQLELGEMTAMRLPHLDRIASVVRGEDRTTASQKVATRMGLRLMVFTDAEEAVAWLSED